MFDLRDYVFHKGFQRHEASVALDGAALRITVSAEQEKDPARLQERLRACVGWIIGHRTEIHDYCTDRLLEDKNSPEWRRSGEPELSRDEFKQRLALKAIHIESDGRCSIEFDDQRMFRGHVVVVGLTSSLALHYATLEG
jgi:hypothetical protein